MKLDQKRIGKRIREIRKQGGLTQEAFGEKLESTTEKISLLTAKGLRLMEKQLDSLLEEGL